MLTESNCIVSLREEYGYFSHVQSPPLVVKHYCKKAFCFLPCVSQTLPSSPPIYPQLLPITCSLPRTSLIPEPSRSPHPTPSAPSLPARPLPYSLPLPPPYHHFLPHPPLPELHTYSILTGDTNNGITVWLSVATRPYPVIRGEWAM